MIYIVFKSCDVNRDQIVSYYGKNMCNINIERLTLGMSKETISSGVFSTILIFEKFIIFNKTKYKTKYGLINKTNIKRNMV